jgi:DNA-binding SARP family transcriptional activator/TolB-like protein/Flp pilus assembly protein TadD
MIRLRTLGALDLRNAGGEELRPVLAQPKRAALLAYLALAAPQGSYRRDTLLALFWPDQDSEHARNALSQAVHFLRRSLGPQALVASNGDELRLDWKYFWCDAGAFEAALNAGREAEALELYQGDLLDGFHVADAPEFQRWLEVERTRLAGRYAEAVEGAAEERQAAGDFDGAVRLWRRLAARDIYSSRLALRLMRALSAAGDPAGAIQHARVHEVLLREELDVAPDPEVAALVRQLQAVRPGPPRPNGHDGVPHALGAANPNDSPPLGLNAPESEGTGFQRFPRRHATATVAALVALFAAGGGAVALRSGAREPSIPPIRSLAVLPLENLSGDSAQRTFADGMHDALISELARYPELTVISRTSVVQYKGTKKRLPEIARELKVQGIVEGTILRDGGRVRVNVQLLHGPSDRHVWAQRYERDLRDILLLQGELAEAIAREVRAVTAPAARNAQSPGGPADSFPKELYLRELYLRGRHAELTRSPVGVETAKAYYRQSIARDSNFALGYAGLSAVYGFMADNDLAAVGPSLDTARMLADRAVALDSLLSETRVARAVTLGDAGEFRAAEREFRRALELRPSDARAHYWYSVLLVALGRGKEALSEAQRAMELDPFGPRGQTGMVRYATWLVTGERPHLRLPVAKRRVILKVEPGEPWARGHEAYDYAMEGQCAEARAEITRARQLAPESFRMLSFVATVEWLCGEKARARALLVKMKRRPDAHDQGFRIALVHTSFGEKDSAFAWLQGTRWTLGQLSGLSADRRADPLRSDPRYPELLRRLALR